MCAKMADGPILLQKDNTFTKLFVGGLPYHTTNDTLKKYFLEFGDIEEAVVIHDKVTQKSKGYGFVSFSVKRHVRSAGLQLQQIYQFYPALLGSFR